MLEMFIASIEESLGLLVRPPIAPIARMTVIMNEIDRLKRDAAEQCNAPVTGQATVTEALPGDWIKVGRHLYWVCDCPNGVREDVDVCAVCNACQPVKPGDATPAPCR